MSKITNDFRLSALRNGVIVRTRKSDPAAENVRYAAVLEMANLGFRVSPDALEGMSAAALNTMIQDARKVIGADRNMRPIYPGFPQQVQAMSTLTLIMEQLLHYWTAGAFLPNYDDVGVGPCASQFALQHSTSEARRRTHSLASDFRTLQPAFPSRISASF